jgi:hypothetical protein
MNRIPTSAALVLVALAAILVAAHLHTYDEPLQTDITGAAVIGHEILAGRALYADMWDHKPPAPPPGAFSVWPVALGPVARDLIGYVFTYLTRAQPELYIVANWTREWITWRHPVPEWLETNGHERGPFALYVRGKLEARVVRSLAVK